MNNLGLKEKALMAIVGMVILYAVAVATWFMSSEKEWKRASKNYNAACRKFQEEERLISEKSMWNERYEVAKAEMPMFDVNKATDTTWLRKIEELAEKNMVQISQRDSGKESQAGDVLELPIEIKAFESSLESLVKFMHALENSSEGMFDVKALSVRPSNKKGYLKGSMSITCAYMREEQQ